MSASEIRYVIDAPVEQICDAHIHVADPRFACTKPSARMIDHATAADYQRAQIDLGVRRAVVVQPKIHGTDNRVTVDAIAHLGTGRTRGIAVLDPNITDAALAELDTAGIRGVRFSLHSPHDAVVGFDTVECLAARIAPLGWHAQLHWTANQIVENATLIRRLACSIVFDHMARLPVDVGISHPAAAIVRERVDAGQAWIKLSGAYLESRVGLGRDYADTDAIAQSWLARVPDRLVWGSDWPHVTETDKPTAETLRRQLERWIDDATLRRRVLVDNPAALYGFTG